MPYFLREYPRSRADANFSEKNAPSVANVFMARIAVVAIVLTGFFVTGDIPSVIQGGRQAMTAVAAWPDNVNSWLRAAKSPEPETILATSRASTPPAAELQRQPPSIPAAATSFARISDLSPGDRLLIWCGGDGPNSTIELLAVDLIDPAQGEALISRQLDSKAASTGLCKATGQPPLRVTVETLVVKRSEHVFYRPLHTGPAVRQITAIYPPQANSQVGPVLAVLAITRD